MPKLLFNFIILVLAFAWQSSLRAYYYIEPCDYVDPCDNSFFWTFPTISGRWGDGRGYDIGYETVALMAGYYDDLYKEYSFVDIRAHHIDSAGGYAGNFGIGWREFSCGLYETFGLNAYYDFRKMHRGLLQQVGVGLEFLGFCFARTRYDFRANGYFSIGKNRLLQETTLFAFPDGFFANRHEFEEGAWLYDAEIGRNLLCLRCINVYGALGPYFFGFGCNTFVGLAARLSACLTRYVNLNFYISHDRIYNTKYQGEIMFSIPFPCDLQCCSYYFRRRVQRRDIIFTNRFCEFDTNF